MGSITSTLCSHHGDSSDSYKHVFGIWQGQNNFAGNIVESHDKRTNTRQRRNWQTMQYRENERTTYDT